MRLADFLHQTEEGLPGGEAFPVIAAVTPARRQIFRCVFAAQDALGERAVGDKHYAHFFLDF